MKSKRNKIKGENEEKEEDDERKRTHRKADRQTQSREKSVGVN